MAKLEKVGVQFVTVGEKAFTKTVAGVNKSVSSLTKNLGGPISKAAGGVQKALGSKLGTQISEIGVSLSNMGGLAGKAGVALSALPASLTALVNPATAAVAAIGAIVTGFIALGQRGAVVQGVKTAFDSITSSIEGVADPLALLQEAANGTISNFDLMAKTNLALAGSSGVLADTFFKALPDLLAVAQVQATATGQSVDFLFESLVTGIKRGSPLLIDNTGLVLNLAEANKAYADELGKTVAQMTDAEKQIALINATVAAGSDAIAAAGGVQLTAAQKVAGIGVAFQNMFDQLSLTVQPLFNEILNIIGIFISAIQAVVNFIAPIMAQIIQIITTAVEIIGAVASVLAAPFIVAFQLIAGVMGFIVNVVLGSIQLVLNIIQGFVNLIVVPLQGFFAQFQTTFNQVVELINIFGRRLLLGGARILGSFANGMIEGFNQFVFPALFLITKTIADFLIGSSPPPKGPLSKMDKGGANTMGSWIDGMASASLQPIEQVAANVAAAMGDIATLPLKAVETRLGQLDKAILPFSNQLEIAKSRFEAIKEPAESALRAVNASLDAATEALFKGEEGSAALVRQLDRQRASIQGFISDQKSSVDEANLQLLLAKAQQSEERALLNIRKKQFGETTKQTKAVAKTAAKAAPKAAPKGAAPKTAGGAGGGLVAPAATEAIAEDTGLAEITFGEELGAAFSDQLTALPELQSNVGLLGDQFDRIGEADFGARISGMFSGVADGINTNLVEPFTDAIETIIGLFTGETDPASLGKNLLNFAGKIGTWLSGIPGKLLTHLRNAFSKVVDSVVGLFTGTTNPDGLGSALFNLGTNLITWLAALPEKLLTNLQNIFSNAISGIVTLLSDPVAQEGLANALNQLPLGMGGWLLQLLPTLLSVLQTPFSDVIDSIISFLFDTENEDSLASKFLNFFTGDGEGTLAGYLASAIESFLLFPEQIGAALANTATFIWNKIGVPIINVLNWAIQKINQWLGTIDGVLGAIEDFLSSISIRTSLGVGQIDELSTAAPDFFVGSLEGAQTGGVFSKGLLKVGEKGEELIANSASRLNVFPNEFLVALEQFNRIMTGGARTVFDNAGAGTDSQDNSFTQTNNFNGVRGDRDLAQRMSINKSRGTRQ